MPSLPPPLNYTLSPYGLAALPSQYNQPVTLAPLLQRAVGGAGIAWAVSESPSTAISNMLHRYGEVWPNIPATSPPVPALTIWSNPTKDRPIVVRPRTIHDHYVTIGDVLCAVHDAIRCAAVESLFPPYQPLITTSLHPCQPPHMRPAPSEAQIRELVHRHLNGRYTWDGLSLIPCEPEAWELHIR